jgi:hypothetical protein
VGEDLTTANLVIVGEGSVLVRTGEEIIDLLRGGQGVFNVVPLAGVVGEVEAAIHRIDSAHAPSSVSKPGDLVTPASPKDTAGRPGPARRAEGG